MNPAVRRLPAAGIFFRDGHAYIRAHSESKGLHLSDGPVFRVEHYRDNVGRLGEAITEAFKCSRAGVPRPKNPDSDDGMQCFAEAAGVKDWLTFVRRATSVSIHTEDGQLKAELWGRPTRTGTMQIVEGAECYISKNEDPEKLGTLIINVADQLDELG